MYIIIFMHCFASHSAKISHYKWIFMQKRQFYCLAHFQSLIDLDHFLYWGIVCLKMDGTRWSSDWDHSRKNRIKRERLYPQAEQATNPDWLEKSTILLTSYNSMLNWKLERWCGFWPWHGEALYILRLK